jgi:hypothetical protein
MRVGTEALGASEEVRRAVDGIDLGMLYSVTGAPEGDFSYYIKIGGGAVELGRGDLDEPDARVRSSYETAARLSQGKLSNQMAFLTGKVKLSGNLGALRRHNAALDLIQSTLARMEIVY